LLLGKGIFKTPITLSILKQDAEGSYLCGRDKWEHKNIGMGYRGG
jgi:hypothetical protein